MASKADTESGSVPAVEQSMKGRGIMGSRTGTGQRHMRMEVRITEFLFVVERKQKGLSFLLELKKQHQPSKVQVLYISALNAVIEY